jgi:hypothetical protein
VPHGSEDKQFSHKQVKKVIHVSLLLMRYAQHCLLRCERSAHSGCQPRGKFAPGWEAACAFAFSCLCFVVSFFDLLVWFIVACLEDFRSSSAVAFGPNDVTGEEKRREIDDHNTPDYEHLPIQMIGFVAARVALAFALDWASLRILHHSMDFRAQISRDLAAAVWMAFDHTGSSEPAGSVFKICLRLWVRSLTEKQPRDTKW